MLPGLTPDHRHKLAGPVGAFVAGSQDLGCCCWPSMLSSSGRCTEVCYHTCWTLEVPCACRVLTTQRALAICHYIRSVHYICSVVNTYVSMY